MKYNFKKILNFISEHWSEDVTIEQTRDCPDSVSCFHPHFRFPGFCNIRYISAANPAHWHQLNSWNSTGHALDW